MLERLDEIDWYQLGHAYGDASDVPDMIRALTSPDAEVRERAWGDLVGSVRHQGSVYSSTPQVVPFVVELLAEPSVPDKLELLRNLGWWSPDYGYWTPYYSEEEEDTDEYSLQTRRAIEEGMAVYVEYLNSPDPDERRAAAHLLTLCFSRRDEAIQALRDRFPSEKDPAVRMEWLLQLGVFNRREDAGFFAEVAHNDPDPGVRLAAALAWVHVEAADPPAEAVFLIDQAAESPDNLFARLPEYDHVVDRALAALKKRRGAHLEVLLKLLRSPSVDVRKDAVQRLGFLYPCPPRAVQALVHMLSDDSADVRSWTAFHLGQMGEWAVREAGWTGQQARIADLESHLSEAAHLAVAGLAERLATERDGEVLGAMCRALKDLALWAAPSMSVLRKVASEEYFGQEALKVIEKLQRTDVQELCGLLDDVNEKVAWMASRVLVRVGRERSEEVVPLLIERLGSWPAAVAKSARLLGELGPAARDALPELRKVLGHSHPPARNAAAEAIRGIDPTSAEAQKAPDEAEVRRQLGESAPDQLVKLVVNLQYDAGSGAQCQALWEIAQMGPAAASALPFVRAAMQKKWLRHDAAGALARLDPEAVRPLIPELLRTFKEARLDGDFVDRALPFLAYLGPQLQPDAVDFLLHCLPTPAEKPRQSAIMIPHTLPYLATAEPVVLLPLVVRLLETDWTQVHGGSVGGILKFLKQQGAAYAGALPAVVGCLKNRANVPLALETVSRIGSWTTALPHLADFLAAEDDAVRKAAEKGVQRLGKAATAADVPALQEALDHSSAVVREAAAAALKRSLP